MSATVLHDDGIDAGTAGSVRAHLVEAAASLRLGRDALDDVALIATELITNALRAGARSLEVSLRQLPGGLELRVRDDAPGLPRVVVAGSDDISGRGLMIVDAVAREWGFDPLPGGGKVVWAIVAG